LINVLIFFKKKHNRLNRQFDLNEKLKVLETLSEVRQLVLDLKDRVEVFLFISLVFISFL